MSRSESIYPVAGWSLGPPNIADPIGLVPAQITYDKIGPGTNTTTTRITEQFGYILDDSVHNTGGVCQDLVNICNNLWIQLKTHTAIVGAIDADKGQPFVCTGQQQIIAAPNCGLVTLGIFQVPDKIDYWWNTKNFAKFGFFNVQFGVYSYAQEWINFLQQAFVVNQPGAGYFGINFVADGFLATGLWYPYQTVDPIIGTDYFGNGFQYDDDGFKYT